MVCFVRVETEISDENIFILILLSGLMAKNSEWARGLVPKLSDNQMPLRYQFTPLKM